MANSKIMGFAAVAYVTLVAIGVCADDKPNIVFVLADDLGQYDVGCYGGTFYETPHLDRLAAEGARFTDAYAACPVCSPTRASLMTGQWPQRTGVTDYIGAPLTPDAWKRNTKLLPAPYADRLSLEAPTLAKAMKAAGYATFFAGKWHLGPEGWWPENQGFDINQGGTDRGGPYGGGKYFSPYGNPRLADGPPGEHLPDRVATETNQFIEAHKDRPFFAYLAFYSVHTPLMAREDLRLKYEEKRQRLGLNEAWGREEPRDVRLVQEHAVYAGMVEAMDLAIGKVLAKLDELNLARKTLVIFTSDNGGLSTSEGWPTSNLPFRGGKGWMYEGGIREPFLVRWPGVASPGAVIRTPISSPDVFPTLLEAAGAHPEPGQILDGVSLVPALKGESLPSRALYWHYPHYGNQGGAPSAAIRRGDWKLIEWFEHSRVELFNLAEDVGEQNDRCQTDPDQAAKLLTELHAWQKEVGAKFPQTNDDYDTNRVNGRVADRVRKAQRPRLAILTDIGGDPDDQQSLVRLMAYSNEFDIEALIATASGTPGELKEAITRPDLIRQIVQAYGETRPNLLQHAGGWPSVEQLLAVVKSGNAQRGREHIGQGHDSPGSQFLIERIDAGQADQPLNIAIWGGQTDLAQALWRVKQERGEAGFREFAKKFRVYDIDDQDRIASWMRAEFPGMNYILAKASGRDNREGTYRGMYLTGDQSLTSRAWVEENIRSASRLGAQYPTRTWTAPNPHACLKEGDTPSWFFFLPLGGNDPKDPAKPGWGGQFQREADGWWRDLPATADFDPRTTVSQWRPAFQQDFARRIAWSRAESP